jgi:hypothetical protein
VRTEVNALLNKKNAMCKTPRNQSYKIALTDKLHMIKTEMDLPILIELQHHLQPLKRKKRRMKRKVRKRKRRRKKQKKLLFKRTKKITSGPHLVNGI